MRKAVLALVLVVVLVACGSARRGAPLEPPIVLTTADQTAGESLFFRHCHPCHPFGEGGLGPALNDKPLPGVAIRTQVRAGLGAMPDFDDEILPDDDLDDVVAYLERLRAGGS